MLVILLGFSGALADRWHPRTGASGKSPDRFGRRGTGGRRGTLGRRQLGPHAKLDLPPPAPAEPGPDRFRTVLTRLIAQKPEQEHDSGHHPSGRPQCGKRMFGVGHQGHGGTRDGAPQHDQAGREQSDRPVPRFVILAERRHEARARREKREKRDGQLETSQKRGCLADPFFAYLGKNDRMSLTMNQPIRPSTKQRPT